MSGGACECEDCTYRVRLREELDRLGDRVRVLEGRLDFLTANAKPQAPTPAEAARGVTVALGQVVRAGDRVLVDLPPETRRKPGVVQGFERKPGVVQDFVLSEWRTCFACKQRVTAGAPHDCRGGK